MSTSNLTPELVRETLRQADAPLALGAAIALSGLLFAAGLLTPLAASGMIAVMIVAAWTSHRRNGFFIVGDQQGGAFVHCGISIVAMQPPSGRGVREIGRAHV